MIPKQGQRRPGRPQGSISKRTQFARDWCERLGLADPVEFLVICMNSDTFQVTKSDADGNAVLDADGKPVKQLAVVSLDTRIQCARELLGYMYPRLQVSQTQTQMQVDVDAHVQAVPIDAVLANPKLTEALSDLALMMAEQDCGDAPRKLLPSPQLDAVMGD